MTGTKNLFKMPVRNLISAACLATALTMAFAGTAFASAVTAQSPQIGEDKAREYAYADAGIDPAAVEKVRTERDYEHGQLIYDVDFYAGGTEYEYHVKAADGAILKKEVELARTDGTHVRASAQIMADKAKEIALADAGLDAGDVLFIRADLDVEDGVSVYELEFCTEKTEYDYEIDANTGEIRKKSSEPMRDANGRKYDNSRTKTVSPGKTDGHGAAAGNSAANDYIDVEKAKSAALTHAGLTAGEVVFTKAKLDYDDGYVEYEIEFRKGRMEYEYTVNARTGAILEADMDWDD